jgi:phage terminase small subunit
MPAKDPETGLTVKQERFCQGIANAMTSSDAYKAAYDADNMKDKTIHEKACILVKKDKIAARIKQLQKTTENQFIWTREMSIKALSAIYKDPDAPHSARVAAVKEINAMHGFDAPKKHDISGSVSIVVSPDENDL